MRHLARVALHGVAAKLSEQSLLDRTLEAWLGTKGAVEWSPDAVAGSLVTTDGRRMTLHRHVIATDSGRLSRLVVHEVTDGGRFATELMIAADSSRIVVVCDLKGGQVSGLLAPTWFDVRIPRVVVELLALDLDWMVGTQRVTSGVIRARGKQAGMDLASRVLASERSLPLVVVAEWEGMVLHPGIGEAAAKDLVGLASVCVIDDEAAWALTQRLGKDLSCFQGAVRLYWPGSVDEAAPHRHPLWTSTRLLFGGRSTRQAGEAVRATLRRFVYTASTLALELDPLIESLEHEHRRSAVDKARAASGKELESIFDELTAVLEKLERENKELRETCDGLRTDVSNFKARLAAAEQANAEESDEQPAAVAPPESVEEAVAIAEQTLSDHLTFGTDVARGIKGVDADAGPPEKVLMHLQTLAELVAARRVGQVGKPLMAWLADRGVSASGEDAKMMKNRREQDLRRWNDGHARRVFELHTKPSEGTSPSRCVRIYFDWIESDTRICIGWVGRKPGL